MANVNIGQLTWAIKADTSSIDKSTKQTETRIGKLGKALVAAFTGAAVVAGIRKLVSFLGEASEAAAVQESAVARLNAALEATGQAGGGAINELQDFASELQQITVVGDETTLSLLQTAINMGLTTDEAKTATQQAVALSRAYGIDLNTALIGVANTLQGQTSTLTRYIPSLKTATDETERLAILNEEAARALEVARKEVDTAAGSQQQLANAIGDTRELIGNYVNESLTPLRQRLKEIVTEYNNALAAQQNLDAALSGEGTANVLAAIEDQRQKVEELRDGIAEGGTAALRLARQYDIHRDRLDEILFREQQRLIFLERSAGEQAVIAQREQAARDAATEAAAEEERRAQAEEDRLATAQETEERRIEALEALRLAEEENAAFIAELDAQRALQLAEAETLAIQREQERHEQRIQNLQDELAFYSNYAGNVGSIFNNLIQLQKNGDDELTESQKQNIIALYRLQQAANIAQVTVDTAAAIVRQYKDLPLYLAIPASVITAAVGATQIGVIASTPPPLQDGGIIPASPGGTVVRAGEAGQDEAIIPLDDGAGLGSVMLTVNVGQEAIIGPVQIALDNRDIVVEAGNIYTS